MIRRQYFYPPAVLINDETGTGWHLTLTSENKLGIMDEHGNVRMLKRADHFTALERIPVTGWLTGILLDAWLQFAPEDDAGCRTSDGLSVLEDIQEALLTARLIDNDGRARKEWTLPAGAGGMEE